MAKEVEEQELNVVFLIELNNLHLNDEYIY